jgi:hypothetical protein
MYHSHQSERRPHAAQSTPGGANAPARECRLECITSNRGKLEHPRRHESIKKETCGYVGALTGVACTAVVGFKNGEVLVDSARLIPCLQQGEQAIREEGLPLIGPILRPLAAPTLPPEAARPPHGLHNNDS